MAYLPPCESLFPLSDDVRWAKMFSSSDNDLHDAVMIEVPHGFLGMNILNIRSVDPMEMVH